MTYKINATTVTAQRRTNAAPSRRGNRRGIARNRSWNTVEVELHHATRLLQAVQGAGIKSSSMAKRVNAVVAAAAFETAERRRRGAGRGGTAGRHAPTTSSHPPPAPPAPRGEYRGHLRRPFQCFE